MVNVMVKLIGGNLFYLSDETNALEACECLGNVRAVLLVKACECDKVFVDSYILWHLPEASAADIELFAQRGTISFENADITVSIKTLNGEKIAEAFNATSGVKNPLKMRWVSLGLPRLLVWKNENNNTEDSPFQLVPGGFYISIETLSDSVASELAQEASIKYDTTITSSQFLALDKHIGSFDCFVNVFDSDINSFVKLQGHAVVIANPVVVFFDLSGNLTKYRDDFQSNYLFIFQCTVESGARSSKLNTFQLSLSKIDELNLVAMLFSLGRNEVYITGYQLLKLSSKIYRELNVYEEYDISEDVFAEEFTRELVQLSNNRFSLLDLTGELNNLSTFSLDTDESFDVKRINVTLLSREIFERSIMFPRINKLITTVAFKEQLSLSTEDLRVKDIVNETAEYFKAIISDLLNSELKQTTSILDGMNQTLAEYKQMEINTGIRVDCAFAMSTRDDYMYTMLLGANLSSCSEFSIRSGHSFALFTSNLTFTVPPGVNSLRVLAVGGGAGGGSCYAGGGGSGYVRVGQFVVTPLTQFSVTVGRGGRGSTMKMGDAAQNVGSGRSSSFGSLLSAEGAAAMDCCNGGNGGSGGGAGIGNSVQGISGAGGTDGGNGGNSATGQTGGIGQGTFSAQLHIFTLNMFISGSGGAGANGVNIGGGGGGGVLMNGEGPSGGRGQYGHTFGGVGYGAGGAGGSYVNWQSNLGYPCYAGGDGADGFVYVEW